MKYVSIATAALLALGYSLYGINTKTPHSPSRPSSEFYFDETAHDGEIFCHAVSAGRWLGDQPIIRYGGNVTASKRHWNRVEIILPHEDGDPLAISGGRPSPILVDQIVDIRCKFDDSDWKTYEANYDPDLLDISVSIIEAGFFTSELRSSDKLLLEFNFGDKGARMYSIDLSGADEVIKQVQYRAHYGLNVKNLDK